MSNYRIRKDSETGGITDFRFVNYTEVIVPKSGGTFTGVVYAPSLSATTFSGDGSNLTGLATDVDFSTHTGDTSIHYTKGSILLSELGSSGHTHPISEVVNLQSELDSKLNTSLFTTHTGDTSIHFTKSSINLSDLGSSAHTHPISEVVNLQTELDSKTDVSLFDSHTGDTSEHAHTTGTTLVGTTLYFDRNDILSAYTADLSSFVDTDTFVTGSTVSANTISITRNDLQDILLLSGGTNVQFIDNGNNSITLNTTSGGGGGASVSFPWKFKEPTASSDPGSGHFRLNNTLASGITEIYVSYETNNGIDASNFLNIIDTGDIIYIQQNDDASRALLFSVSASTIDNTGWFTIPVEYLQGTTLPKKDKLCGWIFASTGAEDNTVSNVGVGQGVFKQRNVNDFEFYSLSGGNNTTLSLNSDTIVIDVTVPTDTNTFVTGGTHDGNNTLTLTRNDDVNVDVTDVANATLFNSHTGDTSIHYTKSSINLSELGSSAHTHPISEVVDLQNQLDGKTENSIFDTHTGDTSIHYTKSSINLSELGSSAHTHSISEVVNLQSELDGKSGNAWQVFSSTTAGQGVVTASTVDDTLSFSGVNIDVYTDNTNKVLTFSAATGGGGGDTFVTGTTFNSNQATVTRNDGSDVLFLTGGTNVTLSNPSTNQIKIDVTIPSDNPNIRNISTTQSILTTDRTLNCTGGTITLTLPTAVGVTGKEYVIKNSGAGTITVDTTSSQTIDGSTSIEIKRQNLSRRLQSNGFNWIVI